MHHKIMAAVYLVMEDALHKARTDRTDIDTAITAVLDHLAAGNAAIASTGIGAAYNEVLDLIAARLGRVRTARGFVKARSGHAAVDP